jgi:hypothetical protein
VKIKYCAGFSLVEAIVAGAIVAIVGVVLVTVLNLFHSQVNEGTLRAMIQMDYDMVSQEIGSKVHAAKWVLAGNEAWAQTFAGERTVDSVKMLQPDKTVAVRYRINRTGNLLQEQIGAGAWKNFTLGNRTVELTPGSGFTVSQNRKILQLRLNIVKSYRTRRDSLVIQGDRYTCKNN